MSARARSLVGVGLIALLVAACGPPTKEELIRKAEGIGKKADLEKALGRPTDIAKLGPMERWTYKAKNGELIFVIVGDTVTLQATGSGGEKK